MLVACAGPKRRAADGGTATRPRSVAATWRTGWIAWGLSLTLAGCGAGPPAPFELEEPARDLCPSSGGAEDQALLVTVVDERVVVVRRDGSSLEIDPHTESPAERPYADFAVSSNAIATLSGWYAGEHHQVVQLFSLDGQPQWAVQVDGDLGNLLFAQLHPDGTVSFAANRGLHVIRDGQARVYPSYQPLERASRASRIAVVTDDPEHPAVGWLDLETGEFRDVLIRGTVSVAGDRLFGVACVDGGTLVRVATPDTEISQLVVPGECLRDPTVGGSTMLLHDRGDLETIAWVDLDAMTASLDTITLPEGMELPPCPLMRFQADLSLLLALTDGTRIVVMERRRDGTWRPTAAAPMSGVSGASASIFDGTMSVESFGEGGQCDGSLPTADDTLAGPSLQLLRPESGVHLSWTDRTHASRVRVWAEGRCAKWNRRPGELVIVDMLRGTSETLDLPSDDEPVIVQDYAWTDWVYEI